MKIPKFHTATYFLIAILALAAVLRFNHINQPFVDVFSWRETSTAMMADNFYDSNWNIFYPEVSWGGDGPNYQGREFQTVSYLAALLYVIVGQQDWVGRSVAVMFGLWGIFALYKLVRRVWNEQNALASAAVMALLPGSIFIERSFFPDPVMVALVTTSFWMLVVYLQTERWRYLLIAAAVGCWGFLTKITGLIVGIPMMYAMLTMLGRQNQLHPRKLTTISVAAVAMLVPVIAYYLWALHLSLSYPPYHFAGSGNWLWDDGLREWWGQNYFVGELIKNFYYWLWTAPVIFLVGLGLLVRPPREKREQKAAKAPWLFHWWFFAGMVYYFVGAKELVDNPWNFHLINPAAAALAGHGIIIIASFTARMARSPAPPLIIAVLLLWMGTSGHHRLKSMYSRPYGDESYKLGSALQQISQPGDLVVTMASELGDPNAIYYSQRRGWVFPPASNDIDWSHLPENDSESIRMFESLRLKGADWLGIANEQKKDFRSEHPNLAEHIQRTCQFHSRSKDYYICRILTPEEVKKRSK